MRQRNERVIRCGVLVCSVYGASDLRRCGVVIEHPLPHAHRRASSQGALPGAPLAARRSSGCLAGRAPDVRRSAATSVTCSNVGRQGALPGAPLVASRPAATSRTSDKCCCQGALLGVPLAFVAIGTVLRTCGNRRAAQLEGYQGALPGAPLVSDKACACTCDHVRVCACKC